MEVRKLGNIYGYTGGNYAGNVYDVSGIAPAIITFSGGNRQPMIIVNDRGFTNKEPQIMQDICLTLRAESHGNLPSVVIQENDMRHLEPRKDGLSNTITTVQKDNMVLETPKETKIMGYRIRKLTPKECGRLMGVEDKNIDQMAEVNSNTQLYKQFGNSIVVDVMCQMFKNLNIHISEASKQYE